jgi:hypothetical protein
MMLHRVPLFPTPPSTTCSAENPGRSSEIDDILYRFAKGKNRDDSPEEKPGRLPFFPKGKWGVVPAFPGSRTGAVPVFSGHD